MLLMTAKTYRARPFLAAAERLGVEAVKVVDMPQPLAEFWRNPLGVDFAHPELAVQAIAAYAARNPLGAIISIDDSASEIAAQASAALGLPQNSPEAATAARDKYLMRRLLARGGVPVPHFELHHTDEDIRALAGQVEYPCVVKPLTLNGSRGVIRADDAEQFVAAARRLKALLDSIEPGSESHPFLVESFIPGVEVALEGLRDHGRWKVLALFDKPDPLDGPFFEETIYGTPSRLPMEVQQSIADCASDAARALGLRAGPMHAELRVNDAGPWLVEVAGRSIGGVGSPKLRFAPNAGGSLGGMIPRPGVGPGEDSLSDPATGCG